MTLAEPLSADTAETAKKWCFMHDDGAIGLPDARTYHLGIERLDDLIADLEQALAG